MPPQLAALRLGSGYALAELGTARPLRLAGIDFSGVPGAEGGEEDDGDCVCRAAVEALLGACGLPSLATVFPEEHPDRFFEYGVVLLSRTRAALSRTVLAGLLQCNVQVFHARPSLLQAGMPEMCGALAQALQLPAAQVSLAIHSLPGQVALPVPGEVAAQVSLLCVLAQPALAREPRPELPRALGELKAILAELQSTEQKTELEPVAGSYAGSSWRGTKGLVQEEEHLPERAQKFERSLATKLHPLPAAPAPRPGDLLIVYTDGASRGNPGPAASGYCVMNELGQLLLEGGNKLGKMTNNQAEYNAVVEVLDLIGKQFGHQYKLELRLDSQLVQRQLTGEYRVKDEDLKELALLAMNRLMNFMEFRLCHIPRSENARADALANLALDA